MAAPRNAVPAPRSAPSPLPPARPPWLLAVLVLLVVLPALALAAGPGASATQPAQAPGLTVTAELGGASNAVALAAGRAYVGVGRRLYILDAGNPRGPSIMGQSSPLPGMILGITVQGTTAYVSMGPDGMAILDVAAPTATRVLGMAAGNASKVVLDEPYTYVVGGTTGVRILDARDPANLQQVGSFGGFVTDLAVGGGHAYTVARNLVVWNVTDPANPLSIRELANWADAVDLSGATLYAATSEEAPGGQRRGFLETWDVSNPRRPPFLGRVPIAGQGRFLAIEGNHAVVLSANRLQHFDASDPVSLPEIHSVPALLAAQQTATVGDHAWLAAGSQGLRAVALSGASPEEGLRLLELPGRPETVAVDGNRLYVDDADQRVLIYPADNLAGGPLGQFPAAVEAGTLVAEGGYLYMGTPNREFKIYDVSDPAAVQEVGSLTFEKTLSRVAVGGGYAYLAADPYVRVIDVRNPAAPNQIGRAEPTGGATDLALDGRWLYVTGPNTGPRPQPSLKVLDVSVPRTPQEMSMVPAKSASGAVAAGDALVFVDALQVVDACNWRAPLELARLTTDGRNRSLALDSWRLYAGKRGLLGGGELLLFDVRRPRQPAVATRLTLPDTVDSVAAGAGRFWAAAREAGLLAGASPDVYFPTPTPDLRPTATRIPALLPFAYLPVLRFDLPPRPCPAP